MIFNILKSIGEVNINDGNDGSGVSHGDVHRVGCCYDSCKLITAGEIPSRNASFYHMLIFDVFLDSLGKGCHSDLTGFISIYI